ncbi:homocysteine S-methyltransferase [Geosmithia morbida]|uniref:Homocysteine S-methyltransferase n=1 Tax=Geosmithia morbida TaxID=1094350 RepID=A0A9P4YVM0_9HYPO|nr:homocysteine S-methyltransferase [Geosmithia morbida]KAF4122860.1 homocysteine S-methyltransferase [Geosmithia morbida]
MNKILILDGGLGTSLEQTYNVKFSRDTPLWSSHLLVADQETLLACQRDFGQVPVDIILTATYQVSAGGFAATRTSEHPRGITEELTMARYIDDAVSIAERAKQPDSRVALSIGPYGACMTPSQEYSGAYDISSEQVDAWHRERMDLFARAVGNIQKRIAFVALETIPRADEIRSMRRALARPLGSVPFWMSCLFPGESDTLPDGTSVKDAVRAMLDPNDGPQPWGVGINCTKTRKLDRLLRRYESTVEALVSEGVITSWPALVLYPDGTNGEVYNTSTQQWEMPDDGAPSEPRESWETQVSYAVRDTLDRGSWSQVVVGGCCMASYHDIGRLRLALSSLKL